MISLKKIKANPSNPRVIQDKKFEKLVKSIQDFPEMLSKRPLVCVTDVDGMIYPLGGNMRLKAIEKAGFKEVPEEWVVMADEWDEGKRKEFIIKDNLGYGEWDWELLANEWDSEELSDWGLDIPRWSEGMDENSMSDEDVSLEEEFDPIGTMDGKQRVVFLFDGSEEAESYLNSLKVDFKKMNMAWQVDLSTPSI